MTQVHASASAILARQTGTTVRSLPTDKHRKAELERAAKWRKEQGLPPLTKPRD